MNLPKPVKTDYCVLTLTGSAVLYRSQSKFETDAWIRQHGGPAFFRIEHMYHLETKTDILGAKDTGMSFWIK